MDFWFIFIAAIALATTGLWLEAFAVKPQMLTAVRVLDTTWAGGHQEAEFIVALEQLVAEYTLVDEPQSTEIVPAFLDFGARLDALLDKQVFATAIDWSHTEDRIARSFSARDLTPTRAILVCYSDYRAELERASVEPAVHAPETFRYKLRVKHFGAELADRLFATEHQMLAALGIIDVTAVDSATGDAVHPCALGGLL